jgi:hypothetical protein
MEEKDGTFECVGGKMELSQNMAKDLYAAFVEKSVEPPEFAFTPGFGSRFGGKWHCPGCGVRMKEESPGVVRCPQCRRNLGRYIPQLVELHPHK